MNDTELGEKIEVKLYRYDPTKDKEPHYENYEVPYRQKMVVLGALEYVVFELGVEFAFRSGCGCNRCGSCGVKMNGVPILACWEPVKPKMVIEPLDNFPILKDCIVDRTEFEKATDRLNSTLVRKQPYKGFPELVTHEEMIHVFKLLDCIECGLCTSACPVVSLLGLDEFAGPAAYTKLALQILDPRDEGDRASTIVDNGIFTCSSCLRCGEVCPQGVDPFHDAIERLKRIAVTEDVYKRSRAYAAFEEAIKESGDVNPLVLIRKIKGIKAITELSRGFQLVAKGRLPLRQPENPGLEEIKKIIDAAEATKR